ncbi:DNA cytosine methyltransferase [Paenibacillus brasilensis]|uniref:Cytosine-specific methyltransferase n=1 Tax=Paenibacillus brasilensis TaxID=128574 RepID=A0ABU0L5X3_9BACL|nr:DNA cytosine methyltransferase [Paenibacillus brasilensis]MDQ0496708.1 DNA (cytosine-5)-methyltransferase 1 [Paenibacillus brasilensis]
MNFLDLFAGAGGLSEGFLRAGFQPIAHIERDAYACKTLETRSIYYYLKRNNALHFYRNYQSTYNSPAIEREQRRTELLEAVPVNQLEPIMNIEISENTLPLIFQRIDERLVHLPDNQIDVIIGGPPCQAYSLVGRARDENSMEDDPRNYLYKLYVRFLTRYQPKAFVFENVPGILTAFKGTLFKNLQAYMKRVGYNIEARQLNAKDFGILQNRKRIIIVGWRKDLEFRYPEIPVQDTDHIVNDLLIDLPPISSGIAHRGIGYRLPNSLLLKNMKIRDDDDIVTHHIARSHTQRDLDIYKVVVEKWNEEEMRIKYTDLPKKLITHQNLTSFLDRFKVIAGNEKYSHTIVAHISKDGHHYIHPDIKQNRSITVREAARIQSFPDNYFFEGPRTANFVQIGNAVPPLMAEKLAFWFKIQLDEL